MRLTNVLFKVNYHRHVKRIWKREGRLQATELTIPPELVKIGAPILDATEILQETKLFKDPKIEKKPPVPVLPSVFEKVKCSYLMNHKIKVSENENQILSLTKTIAYRELPPQISSLIGRVSLPNQDDLVQTSILQAQVWDADQFKLPREIDIERPHWKYARSYGIHVEKKVASTLEKLVNLCEFATGKYPKSLERMKFTDSVANITLSRNNDVIHFQLPCHYLLTSMEPLDRFSAIDEVESTKDEAIPDIYPIKHTLDLTKIEDDADLSTSKLITHGNLHTLFIAHKSIAFWFPKQLLARAISTCFAFTASKAKEVYGENVTILPEPITVQCVYMDLKSFNFLAYQLNTLDLDHNEGIKNQVWIDYPKLIYDTISEKSGIQKYDPEAFTRMLALYSNGLLTEKN